MVKTIELMLGLPTLSLFDLIATDMRASFTDTPDPRPYTAVEPKQSLFEKNPRLSRDQRPARAAAQDSLKMRFDVPDAVPTARLNRIVWGQVKGWDVPYPGVQDRRVRAAGGRGRGGRGRGRRRAAPALGCAEFPWASF